MAEQSDFNAEGPRAWWRRVGPDVTNICTIRGIAALYGLQMVLRNYLRGPWVSYDGRHATRPLADGNFGPQTMAALWAYAKAVGVSKDILDGIKKDGQNKYISPRTLLVSLWLTYYQPIHIDIDILGQRRQRVDPAAQGTFPLSALSLPDDTQGWAWLSRPNLPPDMSSLSVSLPVCVVEGGGQDLGAPPPPPVVKPPPAVVASPSNSAGLLMAIMVAIAVAMADNKPLGAERPMRRAA